MNVRHIFWLFGLGVTAFAGITFWQFHVHLGPISHDHTAWSSFGSLLSGVFTIVGSGATIATLLYLNNQNKEMQKVTQAQMDALTFEQYISHRKLFMEHLSESERLCGNAFKFRDPTHLYNSIFPENSPHKCAFKVEPLLDENNDGLNHIGMIYSKFNRLQEFLKRSDFKEGEIDFLVNDLIDLSYDLLMISDTSKPMEGDVIFKGSTYGFNIFSLDIFIERAVLIANLILRITNNIELKTSSYHGDSRFVREALTKRYLFAAEKRELKTRHFIKGLGILSFVHFAGRELREENKSYLLPATTRQLDKVFSSAQRVNELEDEQKFTETLNICLNEVAQKITTLAVKSENHTSALQIQDNLISLINRKDFK
ncbi:hypothetical protein GIW70_12935 [Pseudomonas syringae]|nr:hypothetical protein [Pseudomonas syringae]MCF5069090.1 hypothetical protein [Pseudomonas syringae]